MIIRYDPDFIKRLKKLDVRIRKSFKQKIIIFSENPHKPQLNNHSLKRGWRDYKSIDITVDLRAVYAEKNEGEDTIAYFVAIGTHKELYSQN